MVGSGLRKLNRLNWGRSELFDPAKDSGEFRNANDDPGNAWIVKEWTAIAERNYRA